MNVAISIFGRAPISGTSKTRLIPALGAEGAAALYEAFLRDTLRLAQLADCGALSFWSADDTKWEFPEALKGLPTRLQCAGGLGERMLEALRQDRSGLDARIVLGSDAPTLPPAFLRLATDALALADVVLGPCADGGYYLVGARRTAPRMFHGVRFSTRHARADTEAACRAEGLDLATLPDWYDVDTPADLALLQSHLSLDPAAAPHSARWFRAQADGLLPTE